MRYLTLIFILFIGVVRANDTLMTHPNYPPLVYRGDDYRFYKYTAKYIPENLLHSFKILATCGDDQLAIFAKRSEDDVVKHGMFSDGYRFRKEFCLDGYSSFVGFFQRRGIFYPYAMKTYILLSFHQYINKEKISWHKNKKLALNGKKKLNKAWKKRMGHVFKPIILEEEPPDIVDPVVLDKAEEGFYTY